MDSSIACGILSKDTARRLKTDPFRASRARCGELECANGESRVRYWSRLSRRGLVGLAPALADPDQETFSYYGPINLVALNMGYHNEHHDLPSIPWNNLPKLRAMAPEFYDNLKYHSSWTRLLFQFIFDERYTLYSRIERMKQRASSPAIPNVTTGRMSGVDLSARPITF